MISDGGFACMHNGQLSKKTHLACPAPSHTNRRRQNQRQRVNLICLIGEKIERETSSVGDAEKAASLVLVLGGYQKIKQEVDFNTV